MTKITSRFFPMVLLFGPLWMPIPVLAWGNSGHTNINRNAARKIPWSMPAFLRTQSASARIAYLGPEPDRWRGMTEYALNNAQAPDHFIDLERIQDLGDLPKGRYEFTALLYAKRAAAPKNPDDYLPEKVGFQPYITMEVYDRLKAAFRDYRRLKAANHPTEAIEQDIVFYAGWLGHYVGDGSQPLHTSVNYDGWVQDNPQGFVTGHGFHWAFEGIFVDRNIKAADFASLVGPPRQLADPFKDYQQYLWSSHALVSRVYELNKAKGFDGAGSPEALKFTVERLAVGSQMLLNLWYTAWLQSAE